jgi:hypothetical protein
MDGFTGQNSSVSLTQKGVLRGIADFGNGMSLPFVDACKSILTQQNRWQKEI